jgi:hypothetical protein
MRIVAHVFEGGTVVLGSDHRVADIFEKYQAISGVLDNDVVEFFGTSEPADDAHRNLEGLLRVGRRLAELAGGNLDVLLNESADDVSGGETVRG